MRSHETVMGKSALLLGMLATPRTAAEMLDNCEKAVEMFGTELADTADDVYEDLIAIISGGVPLVTTLLKRLERLGYATSVSAGTGVMWSRLPVPDWPVER